MHLRKMCGRLTLCVVCLAALPWLGCAQPQVFDWEESVGFSLGSAYITDAVTTVPAILVMDKDTLLYTHHRRARMLQFFDARSGVLRHRVPLSALPAEELTGASGFVLFHAASLDSIWVSLITSYRYGRHDSLVWLLDAQGNVRRVYDLASPYLRGPWLETQQHDSLLYMFYLNQLTLQVTGNRVLFPLTTFGRETYGTTHFHARLWPAGGHLDPVSGTFVPHESVHLLPPDTLGSGLWPDEYGYPMILPTHDQQVLYAFTNHDTVWRYDPITGRAEQQLMAAPFGYTLSPTLTGKAPSQLNRMPDPYVVNVLYDPYQAAYVRIHSYGCHPPGQKRWLVNYYDHQLQFQGAGLLPLDIDPRSCFATPFGLGAVDDSDYGQTGTVKIRYLRPVPVEDWEAAPIAYQSCAAPKKANFDPQVVLGYLRDQWPMADSQLYSATTCYLIVPTDNTCPACMESVKAYLKALVEADKAHYLRVILAGEGLAAIRSAMQTNSPFEIPETVRFDSTNAYLDRLGSFINPRFMVLRGEELIQDEVLEPDVVDQLPRLVRERQERR
jgi:hypothetical protein